MPVDLAAITRDIKNRCARASGNIEIIAQSQDPIFQDPRPGVDPTLSLQEIEATLIIVRGPTNVP